MILDDKLDKTPSLPPVEEFNAFWAPLFSAPSCANETDEPLSPPMVELWEPLKYEELTASLPDRDTAKGPDGVTAMLMLACPPRVILKFFNLLMLLEKLPPTLLENRTIFLPKSSDTADVSAYRPITIASVFSRWFH